MGMDKVFISDWPDIIMTMSTIHSVVNKLPDCLSCEERPQNSQESIRYAATKLITGYTHRRCPPEDLFTNATRPLGRE